MQYLSAAVGKKKIKGKKGQITQKYFVIRDQLRSVMVAAICWRLMLSHTRCVHCESSNARVVVVDAHHHQHQFACTENEMFY